MTGAIYRLLRPLLFQLDPERAHALSLRLARAGQFLAPLLRLVFSRPSPKLCTQAFGLDFENPIGLAAGFDKDGAAPQTLLALGFGHVELGTVTRVAQPGNERPRLHRIPEASAVVNSLGFPNAGIAALTQRLARRSRKKRGIIGINVGKSRNTELADAASDYAALIPLAAEVGDYVTINVSSPNTPGLRSLQAGKAFDQILSTAAEARAQAHGVPLLVKIAPDLDDSEIDTLVDAVIAHALSGIIATNTTVAREGISEVYHHLKGGLSGIPLRAKSLRVVERISKRAKGRIVIVAAGGISSIGDVENAIAAGAELVQMYTALIYEGPSLVGRLCQELAKVCSDYGCSSVSALSAQLRA
jgi:dihydroorotate dehydrogenase